MSMKGVAPSLFPSLARGLSASLAQSLARSLALAFFALLAGVAGASAQAARTWVSGVGDDANPCSRTAPCKTFAGAISKTADGGIIDVLDPGGFGAVTITKGITLRSISEGGSILASATNGININAPEKVVSLVNLRIDGAPSSAPGLIGVNVIAANFVSLENCLISGFKSTGSPTTGVGVRIASGRNVTVSIVDSILRDNLVGVDMAPSGGARHNLQLVDVKFAKQPISLRADALSIITARGSMVNETVTLTNGAQLRSYGDNIFAGGFTPSQTVPLK